MMDVHASDGVAAEMRQQVKWIYLNRPEVKNALTPTAADGLCAEVVAAPEEGARVIVLAGKGGAFCAGAELQSISGAAGATLDVRKQLEEHYHPLIHAMTESPLPVLAAVRGPAVGIGSDIAMAADMRLASEKAFFAELFVNIGLMPDGGGTYHLPRLVGLGRALEMAMTGQRIPAAQALSWGLVNRVFPEETFEDEVQSFALALTLKAPLALRDIKQAIRKALTDPDLTDALRRETVLQQALSGTRDFHEGVQAFLEKRAAQFTGH